MTAKGMPDPASVPVDGSPVSDADVQREQKYDTAGSERGNVEAPRTTSLDFFIADTANLQIPWTQELSERLTNHAVQFLMAGGVLTWERYSMLGDASREAFAEAATYLKIRSALEQK